MTLYFAYGSNMPIARMTERIPNARPVKVARLRGFKMVFNKVSIDGSAKANLVPSDGVFTWGVLYQLHPDDFQVLDRYEGGYDRIEIAVETQDGQTVTAWTYISDNITDDMRAYGWYKELLVKGAEEHGLPQDYIEYLRNLPVK